MNRNLTTELLIIFWRLAGTKLLNRNLIPI